MERLGFIQSTADDSIFTLDPLESPPEPPDERIIVAIYVDDILVLSKHSSQIDNLAKQLGTTFRIREMGPVQRFLGIDMIPPNMHTLHISHRNYAERILTKFDMQACNPAKTPFEG